MCSKKATAYDAGPELPAGRVPEAADGVLPRMHSGPVLGACFCDETVVTCGSDGAVVVYDLQNRTAVRLGAHTSAANRVAAARRTHPEFVFSCSRDTTAACWRLDGKRSCVWRRVVRRVRILRVYRTICFVLCFVLLLSGDDARGARARRA